jgi:hypothetical protein
MINECTIVRTNQFSALLDVAQGGDPAQAPVVGILVGLEHDEGDVGEVGALRLLVDGTLVEARVLGRRGVDGEHVNHGDLDEQNLLGRLTQAAVTPVPARAVQKQAVHVHALLQHTQYKHGVTHRPYTYTPSYNYTDSSISSRTKISPR